MSDFFFSNPLKSISLNGFFNENELSHKIVSDYCAVNYGNWQIAIADVSYNNFELSTDIIFQISTNFVIGSTLSNTNSLILQNVILMKFEIKKNLNSGLIFFPLRWFTINNANDILKLFLTTWPTQTLTISKKAEISFTVLLRRIS